MALDTFEKLLKQADRLTPSEQLLLATRLIEKVRKLTDLCLVKTCSTLAWWACGQREKTLEIV